MEDTDNQNIDDTVSVSTCHCAHTEELGVLGPVCPSNLILIITL